MTKLNKLREKLAAADLEAILIYDELSMRYFTELHISDGALLITSRSAHILTDFRYEEAAEKCAPHNFKITITKERTKYISDILSNEKISRIGFEGDALTFADYKNLSDKLDNIEFVDVGDLIHELRSVKSPSEIEAIKCSQEITDLAFAELLKRIKTDMTEIEVAAELDYLMRRFGSEGAAFETIAVSGDASSLPHGVPRSCKLKRGFLTLDFGSKFNGYCSDMTRTLIIGKADKEMKDLYNKVLEAQSSALEFITAGVDCSDADKVARDIIDSDPRYKDTFGHSLGHSVGLFIHESPSLSKRCKGRLLECGNVITVEPGIYIKGKYGCRIEDMVLIREGDVYNFTKSKKDLIEIY